jgi:hypothetical protein
MMTTRLDLRNLCRRRLGDLAAPYHWSDLQINQWINDAIADYSLYFPRLAQASLETTPGEHVVPLPADFLDPVSVSFPAGQDPPQLLQRLSCQEPSFWELPRRYDVVSRGDGSASDELWLSDLPQSGEHVALEYLATHASLDDDGDLTTLPDRHLELVVLFVRWAGMQELASSEARNPDPTTLAMSTLDTAAARAERTYRKHIEMAMRQASLSGVVAWDGERVY